MSEILEIIMMLCFGISWPINIYNSYISRSNEGKSALFLCFILMGYIAGIISKLTNEFYIASFNQKWYVLMFYFINTIMVLIDLMLYIRNYKLDRLALSNLKKYTKEEIELVTRNYFFFFCN